MSSQVKNPKKVKIKGASNVSASEVMSTVIDAFFDSITCPLKRLFALLLVAFLFVLHTIERNTFYLITAFIVNRCEFPSSVGELLHALNPVVVLSDVFADGDTFGLIVVCSILTLIIMPWLWMFYYFTWARFKDCLDLCYFWFPRFDERLYATLNHKNLKADKIAEEIEKYRQSDEFVAYEKVIQNM